MPECPDVSQLDSQSGYESLRETVGVYVDRRRCVLVVEGSGARRALQGLLTADIEAVTEHRAVYSLALTSKGRPVADPRVLSVKSAFWLDIARDSLSPLLEHFHTYLPPRLARVSGPADVVRVSLIGPRWPDALGLLETRHEGGGAGLDAAHALEVRSLSLGGAGRALAVVRETQEGPGLDLYLRGDALPAIGALVRTAARVGGGAADEEAYRTWRVEKGIPEYGAEITLDTLPQENGLVERTVSFEKGCYTGQEVVARVHYRGHVNRHLRGLRCTAGVSPSRGDPLFEGDRPVGSVTSSVLSPQLGPIALGLVRREIEPGAKLAAEAGGISVFEVVFLPFT